MITYPVVQHESISCVPPDESVATPVPPPKKNENSRTATNTTLQNQKTTLFHVSTETFTLD